MTLVLRLIGFVRLGLRLVFSLYCAPELFIDFVLIKVTAWVASTPAEQIDGVAMGQKNVGVSWRRHQHSREVNQRPGLRLEVEEVKIVQLSCSIMPAKKIHLVV